MIADRPSHDRVVAFLDVAVVVFPVRSGSGKNDVVLLTVAQKMGIDELGPVVRIDSQQCKRYYFYYVGERFEHPTLEPYFSTPRSLSIW